MTRQFASAFSIIIAGIISTSLLTYAIYAAANRRIIRNVGKQPPAFSRQVGIRAGGPEETATSGDALVPAKAGIQWTGRSIMERNGCFACHSIGGLGGNIGPSLDRVYERKNPAQLFSWVKFPQSIKPGTRMPTFLCPTRT